MKNLHYDNFQIFFNNLNIKMLEHGYLYADSNWNPKEIKCPFNKIYFVLDGEGYLIDEKENKTVLRKNKTYIVPINSSFRYGCDEYLEKFYIHFRLDYLPGHDLFEFNDDCMEFEFPQNQIQQLLTLVRSENILDQILFKSKFLECLTQFTVHTKIDYAQLYKYILFEDIFEYVEKNCYINLKVSQISSHFRVNVNTLQKNFKKEMKITLKQYIDIKIVEKVKEDLILTNATLKELSFKYKFDDEFYFSRFFKKNVGISPKQYKINHFIKEKHDLPYSSSKKKPTKTN